MRRLHCPIFRGWKSGGAFRRLLCAPFSILWTAGKFATKMRGSFSAVFPAAHCIDGSLPQHGRPGKHFRGDDKSRRADGSLQYDVACDSR